VRNRVLHWLFTIGIVAVCALLFTLALAFDAVARARRPLA
jgi:hypothetical protein